MPSGDKTWPKYSMPLWLIEHSARFAAVRCLSSRRGTWSIRLSRSPECHQTRRCHLKCSECPVFCGSRAIVSWKIFETRIIPKNTRMYCRMPTCVVNTVFWCDYSCSICWWYPECRFILENTEAPSKSRTTSSTVADMLDLEETYPCKCGYRPGFKIWNNQYRTNTNCRALHLGAVLSLDIDILVLLFALTEQKYVVRQH